MKYCKGFIYGLLLLALFSNVWALITPFDPKIYEKDLISMGIVSAKQLRTGLGVTNANDVLVIRHAVTTGKNRANQNSIILDIKTLEHIRPRVHALKEMQTQTPLSDAQVKSLEMLLKRKHIKIPAWFSDNQQQKYLNVVLQKANNRDGSVISLSTQDARKLVDWAIKHKELVTQDHPA